MAEVINTGKFLTDGQYWKWRFFSAVIQSEELKFKTADGMRSLMEAQIEILKLKLEIYKSGVLAKHKEAIEDAKVAYDNIRKEIEVELEVELKACGIDDITHEIKYFIDEQKK